MIRKASYEPFEAEEYIFIEDEGVAKIDTVKNSLNEKLNKLFPRDNGLPSWQTEKGSNVILKSADRYCVLIRFPVVG